MKSYEIEIKLQEMKAYIKVFIDDYGYPPTVREIAAELKIKSTKTVYDYLQKLEASGFIKKSPSKNRAVEVLDRKRDNFGTNNNNINIPLVGKITAGSPIQAVENIEEVFSLPENLFKNGELFMLNVVGDSMVNAGIYNKDKIIVRQQATANNGEIVVAMMDNEATVKRFFLEKDTVRLQPENDKYSPIIVAAVNVTLLGVVVGLVRNNF